MNELHVRFRMIVVTAVLTALIVGSGVYRWQHAQVQSLGAEVQSLDGALHETLADLRASNVQRQENVGPFEERIEDLQGQVNELLDDPANSRVPMDFLTVYAGSSEHPDLPRSDYFIAVKQSLPVLDKLRILASKLSTHRFSELPIKVVEIRSVKGKRIATIDLQELYDDERSPMWRTSYFQGSSGGGLTQTTLVYSFLQRKYRGDWVDGVRFLYEGKPVGEWDHVNFREVLYR